MRVVQSVPLNRFSFIQHVTPRDQLRPWEFRSTAQLLSNLQIALRNDTEKHERWYFVHFEEEIEDKNSYFVLKEILASVFSFKSYGFSEATKRLLPSKAFIFALFDRVRKKFQVFSSFAWLNFISHGVHSKPSLWWRRPSDGNLSCRMEWGSTHQLCSKSVCISDVYLVTWWSEWFSGAVSPSRDTLSGLLWFWSEFGFHHEMFHLALIEAAICFGAHSQLLLLCPMDNFQVSPINCQALLTSFHLCKECILWGWVTHVSCLK